MIELQRRREQQEFQARLRRRLVEIASLSIADQRQVLGINEEYLRIAVARGTVPKPIAERLQAFLGG